MRRGADLAAALGDLQPVVGAAAWPGHEYVRGWGVFGLPFDSGHVLGLRVFPQNDFGPYVPAAEWGGFGHSGFGRELGRAGLAEYQETKHIWTNTRPAPTGWFPSSSPGSGS